MVGINARQAVKAFRRCGVFCEGCEFEKVKQRVDNEKSCEEVFEVLILAGLKIIDEMEKYKENRAV